MRENEILTDAVSVRLDMPKHLHEKIKRHQAKLIGKKGEYQTFTMAHIDLLEKATKSIK